jgi:heavy metal sensor kinase
MKRIKTLRFRFALWTSALFLVILTGFGIYIYLSTSQDLHATIDDGLSLNAAQVIASLNIDENYQIVLADSILEEPETNDLLQRGYTIRLLDAQGHPIRAFGLYQGLLPPTSMTELPLFSTINDLSSGTKIRVYTRPISENGQFVAILQVAQSLENVQATLDRLLLELLVSIPLLIVITGLSGYWLAARALRPIDQITSTARRISAEHLSARLNLPTSDDEVGRLAKTFDEMLTRLDEAFQRERQFTADASHELRTPLTAMQAVLGMIRERPRTVKEYQQALDDLSEEADRLRTLIESLLQLARGDAKDRPAFELIDLSELTRDVSESLRPLVEAKGLGLTREIEEGLVIQGDSDGLIRLFVNLLDNAIKFTERGTICVSATLQTDKARILIADTGLGMEAADLPHVFNRFYRADKSRSTPGAGIGLTIARQIVEEHGGTIKAGSDGIGRGSSFEILLPSERHLKP